MTDYAGNMSLNRDTFNATGAFKLIILQARCTIGAAGAVGTVEAHDPAITFTKNGGTGDYAITYPKCTKCQPVVTLVSPADTVQSVNCKAKSPTAGTLNIITQDASTAANPANGDVIEVTFFCEAQ